MSLSQQLSLKKMLAALVVSTAAMAGLASAQAAPAPPAAPAPGGDTAAPGRGGGRDQFRQRMSDKMKELLGTNDDEWKALQPRIEKVQQMQRDGSVGRTAAGMLYGNRDRNGGGGTGGAGGTGGGNRQPDPNRPAETPSEVATKAKDLGTALQDKNASADDVKTKLASLREARAKAKADLAKAQEDLRGLLTARQESVLVVLGVLE